MTTLEIVAVVLLSLIAIQIVLPLLIQGVAIVLVIALACLAGLLAIAAVVCEAISRVWNRVVGRGTK